MRPFVALDPRRAALVALPVAARAAWRSSSRSSPSRAGSAARRAPAGRARAGGLAAAHPGLDDRRRARRSTCCSVVVDLERLSPRSRPRRARRRSPSRGCWPRWRPSRATTPGSRCRWWSSPPGAFARGPAPRGGARAGWRCSRSAAAALPARLDGLGRARHRRPVLLRPLHLDRPRAASARRRPRATARARARRGSSGSGRWRSSPR